MKPSRVLTLSLVTLVIFALFLTPHIRAQDDDVEDSEDLTAGDDEFDGEDEEIDDELGVSEGIDFSNLAPHPDISTFYYFPDFPNARTYQFTQGEPVTILIGFHNGALNQYFNISYLGAQFHSPFDHSYHIQNFSVHEIEALVGPGHETTVAYTFKPDALLEPIQFTLSAWMIYNSSTGRIYQSTYFNHTIELLERTEPWTLKLVGQYIGTIVLIAGAVYAGLFITNTTTVPFSKPRRKTKSASTVEAEWTSDNVYVPSDKSRKAGGKKKSSKTESTSSKSDSKKTDVKRTSSRKSASKE